jgi:hypothetical protein
MLRASLLDWPHDEAPAPGDLMRLRDALKLLRGLPQKGGGLQMFDSLMAATRGLGLGATAGANNLFARQLAEARADDAQCEWPPRDRDYLSAADDAAVSAAMTRDANFSRAPALPGRCAETGAAARQLAQGFSLAARLAARLKDMAATVDSIRALLESGDAPETLLSAYGGAPGQGFAAVDSARGRLHHFVQLDGVGRIADYRIVAPTEWNFHPDGPFVRALRGAKIGAGAAAKSLITRRIERLAFAFDPCIRATAEIVDGSHA